MSARTTWILVVCLVAATVAGSAWAYTRLPETVPIHWNLEGKADGFGSRAVAVGILPAAMVGMALLLAALPWLSPKKFEIDSFRETYHYIIVLIIGLFAALHAVILAQTMNRELNMIRLLLCVLFVFFALMGNVMGKIRRNFYVGIKVPWTLASDRVWNETHRLAAWLWVAAGVVGLLFAWTPWFLVGFGVLGVAVVVPILYSLMLYKRLQKSGEL